MLMFQESRLVEAFNKTFNLRVAMGEDGLYGDVKM